MVVVPFLFFTALTVYWWRKHGGLDICVYMAALYAFTSLFAIVIVAGDMLGGGGINFDYSDLELGVAPTLLYCFFICLCILPFSMVYGKELKNIGSRMPLLIDALSVFLILEALLNFYLVADSTLEILSGDLSTVRSDHYEGIMSPAEVKAMSMPAIVKVFYYFNAATILALPIWFYNITFRRKPWWFNTLIIFASLSMPLAGIQAADRTECVFYAMMFVYCFIFFGKFFTKKIRRRITVFSCTLAVLVVAYLAAVSIARFEKREGGTGTGLVQYTGQGYLNFCFFWEHGKFDYISPEREFPMTWRYAFHVSNSPERRAERTGEQGFFMSVFASFIGDIMLDLSPLGMIIWTTYYFLICCMLVGRAHREDMDISEVLVLFMAAAVPVFGIFYYRLHNLSSTLTILLALAVYFLSRHKLVYK